MMRYSSRLRAPAPPHSADGVDGVLIVDKPAGPTSHDIVDRIRRNFGFRKVGHGGTLDPQATGVLVILIGRGTKISNQFAGSDKIYTGELTLGITTHSQDAQGTILTQADPSAVTREALDDAMSRFCGDIYQTPPMVSATKIAGVPLYKLARKGQTVDREAKLIHVYDFHATHFESPRAGFFLRCSKGTYARTLCADVGDVLGCGAHLSQLRRTRSGDMKLEDALTLDEVLAMTLEQLQTRIIPIARVATAFRVIQGSPVSHIPTGDTPDTEPVSDESAPHEAR